MTISTASLVWYRCENWTDNNSHGGDISGTATIVTDTLNNIFSDTTSAERTDGGVTYRKIYFKNINDTYYPYTRFWIESNTPYTFDTIYIFRSGTMSQKGATITLYGSATFENGSATVYTSIDFGSQVRPGEFIYNGTDDTSSESASIQTMYATYLELSSNYTGTSRSGANVSLHPNPGYWQWVQPDSKTSETVIQGGTIDSMGYIAIWIKRETTPGGSGYDYNNFVLKVEDATI